MTTTPLEGPTAVYALYAADGQLLYVGVARAGRERQRWEEHRRDKPWWPQVATRHVVGVYGTRAEALRVEEGMIRSAQPVFNQVHNGQNPWRVHIPKQQQGRGAGPRSRPRSSRRRGRSPWLTLALSPLLILLWVLSVLLAPGRGRKRSMPYRAIQALRRAMR